MAAKGASGTVLDSLQTQLIPEVAQMMALPDAAPHMQFLQALQTAVLKYIQQKRTEQIQQSLQQGQQATQPGGGAPGGPPGAGGPPGMGGPPDGGGMGGPPPGANQIGPGGGAGMSGFGGVNPDDLRRVLAGPAAAGNGGG